MSCAIAALASEGLRPTNGPGKHFVTLETMLHTLGLKAEHIDYLQTLRDIRHKGLCEGGFSTFHSH